MTHCPVSYTHLEQVVAGVVFLADFLGNTGGHGNSGNTGGDDQRVNLAVGDKAHYLAQQNAACGADTESNNAQNNDLNGLDVQEGCGIGGAANAEAQEDGDLSLIHISGAVPCRADAERCTGHRAGSGAL